MPFPRLEPDEQPGRAAQVFGDMRKIDQKRCRPALFRKNCVKNVSRNKTFAESREN
jgi:hypothetical protein